jgi:hypothetical protein
MMISGGVDGPRLAADGCAFSVSALDKQWRRGTARHGLHCDTAGVMTALHHAAAKTATMQAVAIKDKDGALPARSGHLPGWTRPQPPASFSDAALTAPSPTVRGKLDRPDAESA